jgi:hypothetical protein
MLKFAQNFLVHKHLKINEMKKISVFDLFEINVFSFSLLLLISISLVGGCSYRVGWLKSVDNYEIAYRWDRTDGSITRIEHTGWCRVTPLFTKVYLIDSRPMQIRIEANLGSGTSTGGVNNRVLNAKLVQFDPKGAAQFFTYHGLADYDQQQLSEILKIYAYENYATNNYNADSLQAKYKFLKILGETAGANNSNEIKQKGQYENVK